MKSKKLFYGGVIFSLLSIATVALASHSWGEYHWARTANPFTLKVGDNVSSAWDPYLNEAISDWNVSPLFDMVKVNGSTRPKTCRAKTGQIEACSDRYGNTGWLGIAQIWVSGSHITKGITKVNDTYFNTSTYNTPAWRRLVMCQELAHDLGLDHQDEIFDNANLGTCMDYTNDPDGGLGGAVSDDPSNEHPNTHDIEELAIIYKHLDITNTIGQKAFSNLAAIINRDISNLDVNEIAEWGRSIRRSSDGRSSLHVRDLGRGEKVFTFVIWAE